MARPLLDAADIKGPTTAHNVTLDAEAKDFLFFLGCGELSVGIREAARILRRDALARGKLTRAYLQYIEEARPAEVAAYYAAHPDQRETPHRSRFADKAGNALSMRTPDGRGRRTAKGKRRVIPPVYTQTLAVLPPPVLCSLEEQRANHAAEMARIQARQARAAAEDDDPAFAGWDD